MDFAKRQLEKYGWVDGKGLGRNENGIASALKPNLKFDNAGIGHDIGEQFTNNWWERVFNSAANNLDVAVEEDKVQIKLVSKESVDISTKGYSLKELKKNKDLTYGSFIKTARYSDSGTEYYDQNTNIITPLRKFESMNDDELFAACGGRTAHKGARHGLRLNGKLSRIEKQEKMILKKMKNVSISDKNKRELLEKKIKKLKTQKTCIEIDNIEPKSSKKKHKEKRKSVTFNDETVTKYYVPDPIVDSDQRDENSNNRGPIEGHAVNVCDEGIEQDFEDENSEQDDGHKSFEETQHSINDLSKAERQKLKKKRKLEKKNGATMKFLQEVIEDISIKEEKSDNNKKRKLIVDDVELEGINQSLKESKKKKYVNEKKKRKKERRKEKKLLNSIAESLDHFCKISDDE